MLAPSGMLPDGQHKHCFCRSEHAALSEAGWQNASQSEQNARRSPHSHAGRRTQRRAGSALPYRPALREAGVGLGVALALALLRTLIVCCPAVEAAVCRCSSGYFFVLGQIKRQG